MRRAFRVALATTVAGLAAVLVALTATPASAATGSWSLSKSHFNIYGSGSFATLYFSRTGLPNNARITDTSVRVTPYNNGRTRETVTLCYMKRFTSTDFVCTTPVEITGVTTLPTSAFNGYDPRGSIGVRHHLYGGRYPAVSLDQDTVTVSYTY